MKIVLLTAFIYLGYLSSVDGRSSELLKVKLPHGGTLIGRYMKTSNGRPIRGHLGVPYAKPPVHNLRFKEPVPYPSWTGEKRVVNDPPMCTQFDHYGRDSTIKGEEDCLYLNVYSPLPRKEVHALFLPVMIYIHGGGWLSGSAISTRFSPQFLLDHDIVLVVPNYRLGALGFLSTGQEDCPGNNGFKDQVEVLRWVQRNIQSFGGDPKQVTLFGQSAGAAAVGYHMESPVSEGLFHRAISQSGVTLSHPFEPARKGLAKQRATKLAKLVGCRRKEWRDMIECMRNVSAVKISEATRDNFFEWDIDPKITFSPVVEPDLPGAFLTVHSRYNQTPHGHSIPWISGLTTDEGTFKTAGLLNDETRRNSFNNHWNRAIEISLYFDHYGAEKRQKIMKKINDFYFNGRTILDADTQQSVSDLFTDGWYFAGFDEYIRKRLNATNASKAGPTFIYLFNHKGAASYTETVGGGRENYYGVSHGDDLLYLFLYGSSSFPEAVPTKTDLIIQKNLIQMWVNFARTGNPTPEPGLVHWKQATEYPLEYLRIGSEYAEERPLIEMEYKLLQERADFWSTLED